MCWQASNFFFLWVVCWGLDILSIWLIVWMTQLCCTAITKKWNDQITTKWTTTKQTLVVWMLFDWISQQPKSDDGKTPTFGPSNTEKVLKSDDKFFSGLFGWASLLNGTSQLGTSLPLVLIKAVYWVESQYDFYRGMSQYIAILLARQYIVSLVHTLDICAYFFLSRLTLFP